MLVGNRDHGPVNQPSDHARKRAFHPRDGDKHVRAAGSSPSDRAADAAPRRPRHTPARRGCPAPSRSRPPPRLREYPPSRRRAPSRISCRPQAHLRCVRSLPTDYDPRGIVVSRVRQLERTRVIHCLLRASREDALAVRREPLQYLDDLIDGLALAENDLRHAVAQMPMVVQLGESDVLVGQRLQPRCIAASTSTSPAFTFSSSSRSSRTSMLFPCTPHS